MDRIKVMEDIKRGTLKKNAAAKLLGVSRQRITQLYAAFLKKGAKMEEPIIVTAGSGPDKVVPVEFVPAIPAPADIKAVLDPIGQKPVDAPPPPTQGAAGSPPTPPPTQGAAGGESPVDPEDAAAGRDLMKWFVRGFKEAVGRWLFNMKKDDPRLAELREDNEFLKISIKRNSEKAAPLGSLTRGWWGLAIGAAIEVVKGAFVVTDGDDAPAKVTPSTVVKSETPRAEAPTDNADVPASETKRETFEEKIARMNGGA